jgi:hypothetical protein
MQDQDEGILTDEERAELANPVFEEPDPDAIEAAVKEIQAKLG